MAGARGHAVVDLSGSGSGGGNNDTSRAVHRVDSRQLRSDCAVSSRRLFAKYLRFYAAIDRI